MAKLKLKYVNEYIDKTGKLRRYFRRNGKQLGPLLGDVGSAEFMEAYRAYMEDRPAPIAVPALNQDSLRKLVIDFYSDGMFTKLKPSSRQLYRYALDPLMKDHGHRSVTLMTQDHVEKILNKIGETAPGMANLTRSVLRRVMKFAVKKKRRKDNPVFGTEPFKGGEHHTWTDAEREKFEKKWRLGTRQRLAYALLLYTGQRVGDVAKMVLGDIEDGLIHVIQQKTGTQLWIPIHPDLTRAMKAGPTNGLSLIGDPYGRQIQGRTLSKMMTKAIKDAGLPARCVAHGLRKAALRRLAEDDATSKQIAAISGHKTMKEIERYTKAADQKKLARAAMDKVRRAKAT